jgi:hypothetical protein
MKKVVDFFVNGEYVIRGGTIAIILFFTTMLAFFQLTIRDENVIKHTGVSCSVQGSFVEEGKRIAVGMKCLNDGEEFETTHTSIVVFQNLNSQFLCDITYGGYITNCTVKRPEG